MPASSSSRIRQTAFPFLPRLRRRSKPAAVHPTRELGFGLISLFCPIEAVEGVIEECERKEQRVRMLPAWLVVYGLLMMCLYPDASYQEVLHRVALGSASPRRWPIPHKSAFVRARAKLGWEVMERLFRALAAPLAKVGTPGCFWRGLRVMAIDGTTMEVANTPDNEKAFGGPSTTGRRRAGNPQIRVVTLTECGTHTVVDAGMGRYKEDEVRLMSRFVPCVNSEMLLLGDRKLVSTRFWRLLTEQGAHLLWRVSKTAATRVEEHLRDGSYLAIISRKENGRRLEVTVRVVEYAVQGSSEIYRLITSLLDPGTAPAAELARLYHERWEIEGVFDELKTHQRGSGAVLRSQSPQGVRQEFWAHMILHGIVRKLAYKASQSVADRDPDRISFTTGLQIVRRSAISGVGHLTDKVHHGLKLALAELTQLRNRVIRRLRQCPRVVGHQQPRYRSRRRPVAPSVTYLEPPQIFVCGS
jgi:Insertion element 4 transposase N-terminal/Transposase DDE domain